MKTNRQIYRHPVTNKFISKAEWEKINSPSTQEEKEFLEKLEKDFEGPSVQHSPFKEKRGWKFFFFKFWE
jgi:hypothetical protein